MSLDPPIAKDRPQGLWEYPQRCWAVREAFLSRCGSHAAVFSRVCG